MTRITALLVIFALAVAACASGAGARERASGFTVHSSLDGRTTLPHRIRWVARPSLPASKIANVDFFVDGGKTRWVAHEAPFSYAEDGYLVTSFLKPGLHRFTARATALDGRKAAVTVTSRVLPAPEPPAELSGRWQRTVDASNPPPQPGVPDPTFTPSGTYTLTFERRWIRDDFPGRFVYPESNTTGEGLVYLSDYSANSNRINVRGEVVFHPYSDRLAEGGAWCSFSGPPANYTWRVSGDTLTLEPVGGHDACAIRGFIWAGEWTRAG